MIQWVQKLALRDIIFRIRSSRMMTCAKIMDTSDEWISKRTGIRQRHISKDENTSDLASKAALNILQNRNITADQIDFIIVATMTADAGSPSTACLVQEKIGASKAFCFDINAACSGFVFSLVHRDPSDAKQFISIWLDHRCRNNVESSQLGRSIDGSPVWRRCRWRIVGKNGRRLFCCRRRSILMVDAMGLGVGHKKAEKSVWRNRGRGAILPYDGWQSHF